MKRVRSPAQPGSQRDEDCQYCRGFRCNRRVGNENVLPRPVPALCDERAGHGVCGIGPELIAQPDGITLRYFAMLNGKVIHEPGRAHALKRVRERAELLQRPAVYPPSVRAHGGACLGMNTLSHRPLLLCRGMPHPSPCTANIGSSGDIARMVRPDRGTLTIKSPDQPPPLVAVWMDRFRRLKLLVNFVFIWRYHCVMCKWMAIRKSEIG
ncbi:MAG: hypothetical protein PPHEMADMSA_5461 [uncultured Paraburkholderia sp.]|nr:MAG: hypothetical protein PPHEMADMSA_5461 [uncultured Paraburkholderia sp.]CAH2942215.1 MAG: hypothetical protein PPHERAN_5505 [uncultured Paraburkholderia sp.]